MWNYIKGLIRNGSLLTKFLFGSFVFVAVMTLLAFFGTAGKDSLPFLAIGGFSFFKKYKNRVTNYFKNIETVPGKRKRQMVLHKGPVLPHLPGL